MISARVGDGVALALYISAMATAGISQELDRDTYQKRIAPDLAILKTATPTAVQTGSKIVFTVTVTNKRPAAAPNVLVTDVLPPSLTFVSCTSTADGICGGNGNNRTVAFELLRGGVSATIVFVATLSPDVPTGTVIANTATVGFDGTESDTSNNAATATITAAKS